eukprot:scaffold7233_cov63-Attheya_sp.AAC.3
METHSELLMEPTMKQHSVTQTESCWDKGFIDRDGSKLGVLDGIDAGKILGAPVGTCDGIELGWLDGDPLGGDDGADDETTLGDSDGKLLGWVDGELAGSMLTLSSKLGIVEGFIDRDGSKLGVLDGINVGKLLGAAVGVCDGIDVGIVEGALLG